MHRSFPEGPTPEGVYDLMGNVADWTRSAYKPYPYIAGDGRERLDHQALRVVRGGAFDLPDTRCALPSAGRFFPDNRFDSWGFRVGAPAFALDRLTLKSLISAAAGVAYTKWSFVQHVLANRLAL
jgi:hypothetical protein